MSACNAPQVLLRRIFVPAPREASGPTIASLLQEPFFRHAPAFPRALDLPSLSISTDPHQQARARRDRILPPCPRP